MNKDTLSLVDTHELSDILEGRDWDLLEDFVARRGFDENQADYCRWCDRPIILTSEGWVDPQASGDDEVWRWTCDSHDTFQAEHEPKANQADYCPNCGDALDPDYENGFTCDDCTRSQPMGVWVSSWPKISEDE